MNNNTERELTLGEAALTWAKLIWAGGVTAAGFTAGATKETAESLQKHADNNRDGVIDKALRYETRVIWDKSNAVGRSTMVSVKDAVDFSRARTSTKTSTTEDNQAATNN